MKVFNKDFPIKVKFKKSIFDDSFVEEGVIAYLTKVEIEDKYSDPESVVYELSFNQEPFMGRNEILLTECYYQNKHTGYNGDKNLYTAKEAGCFDKRWSDYMDVFKGQIFEDIAQQYFEVIE